MRLPEKWVLESRCSDKCMACLADLPLPCAPNQNRSAISTRLVLLPLLQASWDCVSGRERWAPEEKHATSGSLQSRKYYALRCPRRLPEVPRCEELQAKRPMPPSVWRPSAVMGAGAKVLASLNYFSTDPLFLGRRAKCKTNPMWDCLVLTTSILSLIYLVTLQLRLAKWNPTETT